MGRHRRPVPARRRVIDAGAGLLAGVVLSVSGISIAASSGSTPSQDIDAAIVLLQHAKAGLASASPAPSSSAPTPTPTPTPTATPTVTPTSSASVTAATTTVTSTHAFAPPVLTSPVTKLLVDNSGPVKLTAGVDYLLVCPPSGTWHNAKGMWLQGGRNVVLQNCIIDVGAGSGTAPSGNETEKRGGYVLVGGVFYGENLTFRSSTAGHLTEGIDLGADAAKVTLQGVTMDPLVGSKATNHADCLQAWAGPTVLEVDGFECNTGYQGMFLLPDQLSSPPVSDWDLRNVHLTLSTVAYCLWRDDNVSRTDANGNPVGYTIHTTNVVCTGGRVGYADEGLWPNRAAWPDVVVN